MHAVPARSLRRALITAVCGLAAILALAAAASPAADAAGRAHAHLYGARADAYLRLHPSARGRAQLHALARTVHLPTAVGPLVWSDPSPVDTSPLDAASCPSLTLCVAVDHDGGVLWSTNPIGPPRSWHGIDVDGSNELTGISCPSVNLCVAVDARGDVVTSTEPTAAGAGAWTAVHVDTNSEATDTDNGGPVLLRGIACPSTTLCIAVDAVGDVFISGDPAAGASATWTAAYVDPGRTRGCTSAGLACQPPIIAISCPSVSECAAVDVAGNILTTTTPASALPWTVTPTAVGAFWGISCPTTSYCAAATGPSRTMLGFNPLAPTRLSSVALSGAAYNVFCPALGLCLAPAEADGGATGLLGSTAPAATRPRWAFGPPGGTDAVSCPSSPDVCLALDDEGDITVGESKALVLADLGSGVLPARHPTREALVRAGGERLRMPSAITAGLTVQWLSVRSFKAAPTVLATGTHRFRTAGLGTPFLALTAAGREALAARPRLTVEATATFTTTTGVVTRSRRLVFKATPKPRRHRGRRHRRR